MRVFPPSFSPFALAALIVLSFGVASVAGAATITWNNAAGGNWNTAANWSPAQVPGAADDAVIALAGTYTVTLDVNPSVNSLALGGASGTQTLDFGNHTLTLAAASSVGANGALRLAGATLAGAGSLAMAGSLTALGSSTVSNPLTTAATSLIRVSGNGTNGTATLTVANGFTNNGTIELTNTVASWGVALNVTAGTLTNAPGRSIATLAGAGGGARTLGLTLDNQGTLDIGVATTLAKPSAVHTSSGSINLTGGDLAITQSGTTPSFTTTGSITVPASRTLTVTNGTFNLNAGTITGGGAWTTSNVTVNFAVPFTLTSLLFTPSASTLNGPGLLTVDAGQSQAFAATTVNAPLTNNGTLVWLGTSNQNGALTTGAGSTLRISGNGSNGTATLTVANGFTNNGTIELTNTTLSWGVALNVTAGTLTNAPGRSIATLAGAGGGARTLGLTLDNQGTLDIGVATTLAKPSAVHTSSGSINLTGGDLAITQSGTTPSFTTTGSITVPASRTLTVTNGTFNLNAGTITGGGAWTTSNVTVNFAVPFTLTSLLFTPSASTLNGPGLLTVDAGQSQTFAATTVNAPLTNNGTLVWLGTSNQNGALTTGAGSTLRISGNGSNGTATLTVANGFTNNGTIELTNTTLSWGATLNVTAGTLTNAPGRSIATLAGAGGGARTLGLTLDNQGTLDIGVATTLAKPSAQHSHSGSITLSGGDLTITQSGTLPSFTTTGSVTVPASRTLIVTNGTFNLNAGTITGGGAWTTSNATVNLGVPLTLSTLGFSATNCTINGPGALTVSVGAIPSLSACTVNASLTNNGTLVWLGTSNQNGALTIAAGSTLRISGNGSNGTATLTVANGFTNNGTIELTNTTISWGATLNVTAGTLTNAPGRSIATLAGAGGGTRTLGLVLDNQGTLDIGLASTLAKASAQHTNSGSINVTGGDLAVTQSGTTPSFTNSGTITIAATRSLTPSAGAFTNCTDRNARGRRDARHPVAVTFSDQGAIAPGASPGVFHVTGPCPMSPTSSVAIEIGGGLPGTGYDQLAVTGAVTLDGTVAVALIERFRSGGRPELPGGHRRLGLGPAPLHRPRPRERHLARAALQRDRRVAGRGVDDVGAPAAVDARCDGPRRSHRGARRDQRPHDRVRRPRQRRDAGGRLGADPRRWSGRLAGVDAAQSDRDVARRPSEPHRGLRPGEQPHDRLRRR